MELTDAIDAVRPTVVQITFMASDRSDAFRARTGGRPFISHVLGTGFFVSNEGYVVTAKHVVDGGRELVARIQAADKRLLVGLAQPNEENMRANFSLTSFEIVAEDPRNDLSLLKLAQNPFRGEITSGIRIGDHDVPLLFAVARLAAQRPRDGDTLAISGYPLSNPVLVTSAGAVASAWAYDTEELPVPGAPLGFTRPDVADRYLADVEVNAGNSGGPVYRLADAAAVGVCVATQTRK